MCSKKSRRIPSLVIKNSCAYFSIQHTTQKYLGDPINIVKILSDYGADEIAIFVKDFASLDVCMMLPYYCTRPISISGMPIDFQLLDKLLTSGYDRLGFSIKDAKYYADLSLRYGNSTLILHLNEIKMFEKITNLQKNFSEIIYHDLFLSGSRIGLDRAKVSYLESLSKKCEVSVEGGFNNIRIKTCLYLFIIRQSLYFEIMI